MIYGSVCSGVEAATLAWSCLQGWQSAFFSEIDKFPRAVLSHHWPDVPLHGDFTTIKETCYEPIDLLVGGTPCQSFSVAGLRGGLGDDRGNLALEFLRLVERLRPSWVVWENVPGVLSSLSHDAPDYCEPERDLDDPDGPGDGFEIVVYDDYDADETHALSCMLAGFQELDYGAFGRVLDAQYAGVPQRRRRLFVVGYLGDWRPAAAVLFERESMRRDTPPRRQAGEAPAGTLSARTEGGGGLGTDFEVAGGLVPQTIAMAHGQAGAEISTDGGAPTLTCNHEAPIVASCAPALTQNPYGDNESREGLLVPEVTHTLRGEGFDASEDGTGRGTPVVPAVAIQERAVSENPDAGPDGKGWQEDIAYTLEARPVPQAVAFDTTQITSLENRSNPKPGDPCHTLSGEGHPPAVAFNARQDPVSDIISGAVDTYSTSQAVAINLRGREGGAMPEIDPDGLASIRAADGGSSRSYIQNSMAVRRLTPLECERLQGMPDNHTRVPYKGRPAEDCPDGPRYKAIGNSMAVPCMRWIGERIQLVNKVMEELAA